MIAILAMALLSSHGGYPGGSQGSLRFVAYQDTQAPPAVHRADTGTPMTLPQLFALDLVAIAFLVFVLYFPRHRRRDMVVALLGINVGVLGVTQGLSSAGVSAGLGLGLFGVLSIIRLRSTEMDQSEVAYYFAALTLGLLGGFAVDPAWLSAALMVAIVAAVAVGDHPRLFAGYRHQVVTLDRAVADEAAAREQLSTLLGARVHRLTIRRVDLVQDTTVVDVRYQLGRDPAAGPPTSAAAAAGPTVPPTPALDPAGPR